MPTRGTTAPNRLRRVDRWIADVGGRPLRSAADPLVADLGFGASTVTTLELADRLAAVRPDVEVVGFELDKERLAAAVARCPPGRRVSFRYGGFELPLDGRRPVVARAMNVLRQYAEADVVGAWRAMANRLAPDGILVEGTCDELGRVASWVAVDAGGQPRSLTVAAAVAALGSPATFAERLPKALIHRNVEGEPVHAFLVALDRAWLRAAAHTTFGARQRWRATVEAMRADGWPVLSTPAQAARGELTVAWSAVAPGGVPE